MSHLNPGLLSAYNSLTDKHLAGYFSNTRIRRHLQRAGLITRSGRIVPDKEYRHKLIQRAHQRHVRECLAQAIFHKVLEMERLHQIEIKRKLEEFARRERVHKIKVERSRRYEDDIIRILSPRPPTGVRSIRKQQSGPEGHSESSESPGSSRPNTAPGKMQRPVRLKPIHSNSTTASLRRSSPYNENDQPANGTMDKESRRRMTTVEPTHGISPYCLPVINNFVTPVPPATKRKERGMKVTPSGTLRGRRLRPTTSTSGADVTEDSPLLRGSVHQSRVSVTMVYFGKTVHLSHDLLDMRDEVKVFQQHCGGENLCVFKGKLREGETFQFISRRHRGFPFSLTFFLNGLQVERLSSCCEFKHRKGPRLGGRHGHFGFFSIDGASPCYKCIIAMGLDKKPTPPPRRVKEEEEIDESVISPKDAPEMETEKTGEDAASYSDSETSQQQDMRSQVKEEKATAENNVKEEYEEDFEADDEGPAEEAKEKKSASPSSDTELQVKEGDIISETEGDENDDDIKSQSRSSCSGSDQEASDAEDTKDSREDQSAEQPKEVDQEDTAAPSDENDKSYPEEPAVAVAESGVAKESDLQDSAGDSTEIDISDTSIPSGQEHKPSDDTSGGKQAEETVDEGKQEEQERAKSVQEKLAEAILKQSQCSSEPEMSDTSTEEEEEATDKGQEQNRNVSVTSEEQQQTEEEQAKCEESVCEAEEVLEETSEPQEQADTADKERHENRDDDTKDETVKTDEEDEYPASKEETAENEMSEDTDASLQPAEEDDAGAKCTDPANEEADAQPDETGQGAKGSEVDESAVSELNKKTDEPAASGDAEAEVITAEKTMEMKAEPSEAREALSCEEAPVSDTEEPQQGDGTDPTAASQTEVTAEDSSSSLEGSGATTVEKPVDASQDNILDGGSENDNKEEEAADGSRDGNQQEEINSEVEGEKSEQESKEGEEQADTDETADGDNSQAKEQNQIDKTEEEEQNDESKTKESEENIGDDTKTDSSVERQTRDGPAEKALGQEDEVAHEEREDESEKTDRDEDRESVKNKSDETESESKGATADESNKDGEVNEAKADGSEEKSEEAEKEEEDATEGEQSESEKSKDHKESEEKNITYKTEEGQETSENTDEHEENTADVAEMTQEISNTVLESEDAQKETEGASVRGEKGEIDAENGEISTEATQKSHGDDETAASSEQEKDVKPAARVENEPKTEEESTEDENTEVKDVECGDDAEKHDSEKLDQAPDSVMEEREVQEGDDSVEKQATEVESKPDTIKEEREEMKQDENGNTADPTDDNKDSDSSKNIDNMSDMIAASSRTQAQPSAPTATSDKHTPANENDAAAAAGGGNGADADEASTTSEEGASVLLKPQARDDEADAAVGKETPKALSEEDNTDLVTNWITMHQMSKFFEKFVEPLEDLREDLTHTQVSFSSKEETPSTELQRLDGAHEVSENEEKEQTQKDESESGGENKVEALTLDLGSKEFEEEPTENNPAKDTQRVKEETEVEDILMLKTETEDNDANEQRIGSKGSLEEDRIQEGPMAVQSDVSKTDVESIAGCNQSLVSGKPESDTGQQSEEKTTGENLYVDEKQTGTEGTNKLTPPSETEEDHEHPEGPDGQIDAEETWGKAEEQSGDVTEITDFTTSRSQDGSQEESQDGGIQLKPSDGRASGELIQDIGHAHSKDRLSAFSVDERFGRSSYSLLSSAKTESLH